MPSDLAKVHDVFHVSMLRKYITDHSHVLSEQPVTLRDDLAYEEELVQILDRREQQLRNKVIPLVKVLWRNHLVDEATWEPELQLRQQYPHLFHLTGTQISRAKFLFRRGELLRPENSRS